jgi:F-type H+-transporting ATPase subunit delta
MNELIAKRYAKALMELVPDKELPAVLAALRELQKSFTAPEAAELIASPLVGHARKFDLLIAPLKKKIDGRLYRLLELMSEKGRLDLVPQLAEILAFEIKKRGNKFEGTVEADEALPKEEIKRLEEVLAKYSGAKIKLKQIGKSGDGLRVSVEDLSLELNFSKTRVKSDLLDFIQRAL